MFKAIYLTGTIVAFCFALLWLDVDEMREEMREEERGYYREKPHGKEKAALVWAQVGTALTVGLMWWLVVVASIGVTPVTEVKQSAKIVALNNRVDTTEFTDDSEKTVIVEITNITELDGKEIARKTTKRVVKNVTKDQKSKQKAKGAA